MFFPQLTHLDKFSYSAMHSGQALVTLMDGKLDGDNTVLQNIRNSGKEDLYAELMCFLSFGSLR